MNNAKIVLSSPGPNFVWNSTMKMWVHPKLGRFRQGWVNLDQIKLDVAEAVRKLQSSSNPQSVATSRKSSEANNPNTQGGTGRRRTGRRRTGRRTLRR